MQNAQVDGIQPSDLHVNPLHKKAKNRCDMYIIFVPITVYIYIYSCLKLIYSFNKAKKHKISNYFVCCQYIHRHFFKIAHRHISDLHLIRHIQTSLPETTAHVLFLQCQQELFMSEIQKYSSINKI